MFVGHIVPPAIRLLLDHLLMSSSTHEMYIPRRGVCIRSSTKNYYYKGLMCNANVTSFGSTCTIIEIYGTILRHAKNNYFLNMP